MPASTWRRASARTAASSMDPSFLNGVISAVPMPVKGVRIALTLKDVGHREPAAPADDELGGRQRPGCKTAAIPCRVCQLDRIRDGVETDRVSSGNRTGPR